ncbi:MAG: hypothetical protein LBS95_02880 [Mycoplasmataceae bacterium]|jgi:hypothetical protein|nr:hypothetical protein [Mycoplasmataceae bacterium]
MMCKKINKILYPFFLFYSLIFFLYCAFNADNSDTLFWDVFGGAYLILCVYFFIVFKISFVKKRKLCFLIKAIFIFLLIVVEAGWLIIDHNFSGNASAKEIFKALDYVALVISCTLVYFHALYLTNRAK